MLHPILQIARRNGREGQWSLPANDARLWYDETPASPLWANMRKANEVAREMWAPSKWEQRMSLVGQFTTFCRTHEQTTNEKSRAAFFDGNIGCGATDPTAVRQDVAVYVGNGSNPAGHDDSRVTKNCGVIGNKAGALIDNGRDGSIYPQPDRLEATCCLTTCVDNGESFV
ncbi:hypothetical protein TcYC6_0005280 [Trypanosoma cruzi]|nr:hypothetical protein TcYC6_0005280 [Trypanosoma cruzi]